MRKQHIIVLLFLMCISTAAFAQKKAETNLYNKTIAKPSISAFDKFLKKYPSSVYSKDINARKDTLLNISPLSPKEAYSIISDYLPSGSVYKAFADRNEAIDRIYALCIESDSLKANYIKIITLRKNNKTWELEGNYDTPSFEEEGLVNRSFVDSTASYRIRTVRYFQFSYLLSSEDGKRQAYVAANYGPLNDDFSELAFIGNNILTASDSTSYRISGRSNASFQSDMSKPQKAVLLSALKNNKALEEVPENEYLSEAAIEWWQKNNPDALTSASSINVNILPEGCSLIDLYTSAKGKKTSSKYGVALFDAKGYSFIIVCQKSDGKYLLAWLEPECKNHSKDRLLNSISFEDANTLVMNYYQGNKTFKYRFNLSSKSLRRR